MRRSLLLLTLVVLIAACFSLAYGEPVKDGLIANWSFDEGTVIGDTVKDLAGNYDATIKGDPKIIPGRHGQAIEFDGINDYVYLTALKGFGSHLGTFSIDFWIRTGPTWTWTTLFKTLSDVPIRESMGWAIDLNRSAMPGFPYAKGVTHFYVRDKNGKHLPAEIDADIYDSKWHHIGWVVEDASSNTCKIYVDGVAQEVEYGDVKTPEDFIDFQYPVYLGAANNRGNIERLCRAAVDEFRIYTKALTAAEILHNLASGAADVKPPDPPSDLISETHTPEQWSGEGQISVKWTPAVDLGSGVDGYSIAWDQVSDTVPDENKDMEETATQTTSPALNTGNDHYFHIRAVDNAGNWGDAAHLGPFFIDVGKPWEATDPVSTTHTPGAWSSAQAVKVSWNPAQDSGSGLAGYAAVWDTSPDTLPAEIMNLGAHTTEAESAELADGDSHYSHIRSVDSAGNWCDTAVHIGPFWIDGTPPTLVTDLSSPSHPIETCSSDTVVQVTWSPAIDVSSSGLQGCSVLWDTTPDTLPDDTAELGPDVTEHASPELPDGNDHYFHIRSIDNVGNALDEAVHIGPFYIDTGGPGAVTDLQSTSHQIGVWSNDDTAGVQWTPAVDLCSEIDGYSLVWDDQADTIPDEVKDIEGDVTAAISPALADGAISYHHIRAVDTLGDWGDTAHLGPFLIDVSKPSEVTDLVSPTHTPSTWSPAQVVKVSWNPAPDSGSGLAGYAVVWDTSPDTLPEENMSLGADVTEAESPELADGDSHWFHIRSVDKAGNWCDTATHTGPFWTDGTPPTLVTGLSSPSHPIEACSSNTAVQVTWTSATDESSGLQGYLVSWDTTPDTLPDDTVELGADVTEYVSPELPDGKSHYFHIRSIDTVGNASDEAVHIGPFHIDTTGTELVTDLKSTSHQVDVWSNDDTVEVQWTPAVDQCSGVDGYSISWDDKPGTLPDDAKDVEEDVTTATSPPLAGGNGFYCHVRGVDNLGNWSDEAAHLGPFLIDVNNPPEVAELKSGTHTVSKWTSTQIVKVSWTPAQDSESGLAGYSATWDTSPDTLPEEKINLGADATEAESEKLADGDSHYFHVRSVDVAGNWCDTAAHIGPFFIDSTPSTLVTGLSSPSHKIRICSSDTVVKVTWTSATDISSGVQGYSVLWDTTPDTLPDDTVGPGSDATEYASPELADGRNHYFHIRSIDNAGNALNKAVHIGPFYIDTTGTELVTGLKSTSHLVDVWSNDDTVDVQWKSAADQCGVVDGYSIAWDDKQDTLPDDVKDIEGKVTAAASPPLGGGNGFYFHIRGVDDLGNWSDEAAHLGPFLIDVNCPSDIASLGGTTPRSWSPAAVVKVSWTPAQDDGSGLAGYSLVWDTTPDTLPDDTLELGPDVTEAKSAELADGDSHYLHIRSLDKIGNWCDAAVHIGPFYIDTTVPTVSLSSSSHKVGVWSTENVVTAGVSAADELSGLKGYSVVWDEKPDTEPEETQNAETSETVKSPGLADGEWYLHVKSVDNAGNWSASAHLGPFLIDVNKPSEVAGLNSTTHVIRTWSSMQVVRISWAPAQDGESGLAGYSATWDTSPDTLPQENMNLGADVTEAESPQLADGDSYYFHIRSVDVAGNWCDTAAHTGPFYVDANPPEPVIDVTTSYAPREGWSTDNVLRFSWKPAADKGRGLDGYAVVIDSSQSTISGIKNLGDTAVEFTSARLDDGRHYFHIRPVDRMGFWGQAKHVGPFMIDATPPPVPYDLRSTSHEMGVWSNQRTAGVSWQGVTDETSGLQGYSFSWDTPPDEKVDFGPEGTSTSQALADGTHYFHVKALDKAGNWSDVATSEALKIDTTPPHSVGIYKITEDSGEEYTHVKDKNLYYSAIDAAAFAVYATGTDDVSGLKQAQFQDCVSPGDIAEDESPDPNYSYSHRYEISRSSSFDGWSEVTLYDHAENTKTTSFRLFYDNIGPDTPTNVKCDDGASWNTTGKVKVTWEGEGDGGSGVADYYVEAGNDQPQKNPGGGSRSATISVGDVGSVTFYVRGRDNVGNWGQAGSATIGVDTKPPGEVQEIVHTDSDSNPGYDNDAQVEFSWQPATDNIRVDYYEVHLSVDGGGYKLQESVAEESYTASGKDGQSYSIKVMAVDPAGNKGALSEPSEKTVCDMTPPIFVVAMIPNPGFRHFMDIVIVSLETLEDSPTLSVSLAGEKSVPLSKISENVWVGSYTIEGSGKGTLIISGTDLAGNETVDESNSFSVQSVLAGGPARIQSADGMLALNIPAGALEKDTMVTITPVMLDPKLTQSLKSAQLAPGLTAAAVKLDELESASPRYLISPDDTRLLSEVTLTLQYEDTIGANKEHVSIYVLDKDVSKWEYVDSLVDERTSSISASVERFGIFGLYSDTKAPQVSHISPADGAVLDTSLPEFVVRVTDNGSGVNLSSLSLLIDGQTVKTNKKYRDELVVLTLERGLAEGAHTFSIMAEDLAGNPFAAVKRTIHVPMWAVIPDSSQLLQNYPNPFNPETWIPYKLSQSAYVELRLYNASGQLVRTLELGYQKPGTYTDKERAIYWDGKNGNAEPVSSGVYFYHLSAGRFSSVRKMAIAR